MGLPHMLGGVVLCLLLWGSSPAGESCSEPDLDIAAGSETTDTIDVGFDLEISDVEVQVSITHAFQGDLEIDVTAPTGTTLRLKEDGELPGADVQVTFSDEGSEYDTEAWDCDCLVAPYESDLSVFDGDLSGGDWELTVGDLFEATDGTLDSWCMLIEVCPGLPGKLTCGLNDEGGVDLEWPELEETADAINVYENDVLLETLDGDVTSYTVTDPAGGAPRYRISTERDGCEAFGPDCDVAIGLVELCQEVGAEVSESIDPTEDVLTVDSAFTVRDLAVYVDVTHTFVGDLQVDLTSPADTTLRLKAGGTENLLDLLVTFSDAGSEYADELWDCDCRVQPYGEDGLAVFDDEDAEGDWTMVVEDLEVADDGTFNEWCLIFFENPGQFLRGDANGNAEYNLLGDPLFLLNWGFIPGSDAPPCLEAADFNGDGKVSALSDGLFGLSFGFEPTALPIPAPHPDCGLADELLIGCETPPDCGVGTTRP